MNMTKEQADKMIDILQSIDYFSASISDEQEQTTKLLEEIRDKQTTTLLEEIRDNTTKRIRSNDDVFEALRQPRKEKQMMCRKCSYKWLYSGIAIRPTCPSCMSKTTMDCNPPTKEELEKISEEVKK